VRPKSRLDAAYGFILSLLVVLTSATAVRVFDIRLSDISFGLLLLLMLTAFFGLRRNRVPVIITILLVYLVGFSLIQGAFAQFSNEVLDYSNYIAVPAALGSAVLFWATTSRTARITFLKNYGFILLFLSLGIFGVEQVLGRPSWVEIIDETDRFSALSLNPNQLALFMLPVPFVSLVLWKLKERKLFLVVIEISSIVLLNVLVFGKSLFMAWIVGAAVIIFFGIAPSEKWRLKKRHVLLVTISLPIMLLIVMPVALRFYVGDAPGSIEGQGEGRLVLWVHGLAAWVDAPLFGHGPGHYSGLDAPYEGMESHNLIVDWLSAYGLVGLLVLITFFYWVFRVAFRKTVWVAFALLIVLAAQSFFHFYARQPIFWIWWLLCVYIVVEFRVRNSESEH
jgi:O-antigen ligase